MEKLIWIDSRKSIYCLKVNDPENILKFVFPSDDVMFLSTHLLIKSVSSHKHRTEISKQAKEEDRPSMSCLLA